MINLSISSVSRLYRGGLSTAPGTDTLLESLLGVEPEETKLAMLYKNSIRDTKENREICFWNEPVAISFAYITAYTLLGEGFKVTCSNPQAKEIIDDFNDQINASYQDIADVFCDSVIDGYIHGGAWWRVLYTKESPVGIDIGRLDPLTLVKIPDPVTGYECLVQQTDVNAKTFYTRTAFNNFVKERSDVFKSLDEIQNAISYYANYGLDTQDILVTIPDTPEFVLDFEFFRRPMISPVLNIMAYKRWIEWFMRNFSERQAVPFRAGFVGDPKTYMPEDPEEFKKERDNLLRALLQMKSFGALATAGYNRIEEVGKTTAKAADIFINAVNLINDEIMMSMCGSMGTRQARGTELATSRTLDQQALRYYQGLRGKYTRRLSRFYRNVLLAENNIKVTRGDLQMRFPPLMLEKMKDVIDSIKTGCESMIFDDWNEPRQIASGVFGEIMDELPKDKADKLKATFIELNKKNVPQPGQAGGFK